MAKSDGYDQSSEGDVLVASGWVEIGKLLIIKGWPKLIAQRNLAVAMGEGFSILMDHEV